MVEKAEIISRIVRENQVQDLRIRQIHIYREGEEDIYHEFMNSHREDLYSASKVYTSVAIGMAIDDGQVDLEMPVIHYFPEFEHLCTRENAAIRVRDLLQMNSGKDGLLFRTCSEKTYEDYAKLFFSEAMVREAGSGFNYNNMNTYMLGRLIENVYGKDLKLFLEERLFGVFGYFNVQWHTCPNGHPLGFAGLYLRTDEFARLGQLLLYEGLYGGKRLVSKDYVRKMHTDLVPVVGETDPECINGYGYQIWRGSFEDSYRADGMYGQFCIVYPSRRSVVTVTARNQWNTYDIIRLVNQLV